VLGVSYDSPEANRRFAATHHLPFRLLSDGKRALARAVGAAVPLLPFPKRMSILVGSDGRVLKVYPRVTPATHAAEVISDFRALSAAGLG
jgi:thioredoxin-dependent peroxiredoxin